MNIKDKLATMNIINTWDILMRFGQKGKDVAVTYTRRADGRGGWGDVNKSQVFSPSHETDHKSHFSDYGSKSFVGDKAKSMPLALAWAGKTYGVTEWVTCPTCRNTKIPRYVLNALMDMVKGIP